MGAYSNTDYLQRIAAHERKQYEPSLTSRIQQLEKGFQTLTLKLAEANKTITLQDAQIRELQRDMNGLIFKSMTDEDKQQLSEYHQYLNEDNTSIDCSICGHDLAQCTCNQKMFS